jgi:hypothetical protein
MLLEPIIVTAQSEAWTVSAWSDTGIVGLDPTKGIDDVCVYSVVL